MTAIYLPVSIGIIGLSNKIQPSYYLLDLFLIGRAYDKRNQTPKAENLCPIS